MDINQVIGKNLTAIRQNASLTLETASQRTGVSRSMLSEIEHGCVSPSIGTLWKIAEGLNIPFTALLEQDRPEETVIRKEEASPTEDHDGAYINYTPFPISNSNRFESNFVTIEPGCEPHVGHVQEHCEKFITVFSGTLGITLGDRRFTLKKGDSIRFSAASAHCYINRGKSRLVFSLLLYFPDESPRP